MMEKYYKTLNLEITATLDEVKKRHNELIEEFNPEKQEDDLKEFFKREQEKINDSYRKILENIIETSSLLEDDDKDLGINPEAEESVKNNSSEEIENSYKIFGLKEGAALEEVEDKYKDLLSEYNPDHQSDDLRYFFEEEQEKVMNAYKIITQHISEKDEEYQKEEEEIYDLGVYQGSEETKFCKFCGHMQYVTNSECVNCRGSLFPINNGNVVSNHVVKSENQKGMFISPFSFNGRIRRLEYGFSFIIFVAAFALLVSVSEEVDAGPGISILLLPGFWFIIAQGAKRCHDMSLSGWMQLIPYFNPLALIFASGKIGDNKYGSNPKGLNYN